MGGNGIKPEDVEKMLCTKSVQEVADYYGVSKGCMYKFTSIYKIDVGKLKRKSKKKKLTKSQGQQLNQEKYYNVVHGYLTKNTLEKLLRKYTSKQICCVFKITKNALKKKAANGGIKFSEFFLPKSDKLRVFSRKVSKFKRRVLGQGEKPYNINGNKKFRSAVSKFKNRNYMNVQTNYTYKKALEYLGGVQTTCYLTGRPINIEKDDYHLDHIIPVSKGGTNELSNMGITIPQANKMKCDLTPDELLSLCKEILVHNNYTVIDPNT